MLLKRKSSKISHRCFADLASLLHPTDLLVINNTRVVKSRLVGNKETGGNVEVLLLDYPGHLRTGQDGGHVICECLVKASKPPRPGSKIIFAGGLRATVLGSAEGVYRIALQFEGDFDALLERIGHVPLPPYIKRNGRAAPTCDDREAYQTIYAEKKGAVAAPTAGLHFSPELFKELAGKGVEVIAITLHVGYGTFLPVRVTDIRQHNIHPETYELTRRAASLINEAMAGGRRIIAVGTTSVRVLEYAAHRTGRVRPGGSGKCDLFIYPGFQFKVISGMITNFHLPESTLLMLVSAFAGREFILDSYQEAICRQYRFYSYGDAMLIL
jgi:S-adenosylmethionine:tRNA ribosyltransferase-isomerase